MLCVQTQLQSERFFGKPKLALDAVGGESATRLADALEQVRMAGWSSQRACAVTSTHERCTSICVRQVEPWPAPPLPGGGGRGTGLQH
jgi:hypothetical protein